MNCKAKQYSDQMSCECGNVWDVNDAHPPQCRKITSFKGEYRWLSNFHPAYVNLDGIFYKSVENAYQAAKTNNHALRAIFMNCTPGDAKRYGRALVLRPEWDDNFKISLMYFLNYQKYILPAFKERLLATGNQELIEGNTWNDVFWGVCRGKGENHLGKILMRIRNELRTVDSIHEETKRIFENSGFVRK